MKLFHGGTIFVEWMKLSHDDTISLNLNICVN